MNIKSIREKTGLSQSAFSARYGIPIGTLHHWEAGDRQPPEYLLRLLQRVVEGDLRTGEEKH